MRSLSELDERRAAAVRIVLTDIDDTLTTKGRLGADAYAAIERLQSAGVAVIPVTGRPAGWCDLIARFWPVDGVVGENGAFYFRYDRETRRMRRRFWAEEAERERNRRRLDALAAAILAEVPGAALAADQPYRVADLAIDFREDVEPLPPAAIDAIVRAFEEAGATAKVSSIHVNGWFGAYDKLTMTKAMLAAEFAADLDRDAHRLLFVGDSPNDEPMFQAFALSIGVANVIEGAARLRHFPKFVTKSEAGAGFVELADHLLRARGLVPPLS
jgi:HAD superfamily hydrolase (TIGR01484 family)